MQQKTATLGLLAIAMLAALPTVAQAGMPSVNLTDVGRMSLSALSFFGAGYLASVWGIQCLWNLLQRDFPRLPRLTFKTAAGVVFLWGMLFVLVLTMISGARELMTPEAWQKQGLTYKLSDKKAAASQPEPADASDHVAAGLPTEPQNPLLQRRERQLLKLHVALLAYAALHEGRFPPDDGAEEIDPEAWNLPGRIGTRYLYLPGRSLADTPAILAFEPQVYDDRQLALWSNGRIAPTSTEELQAALPTEAAP